MFSFESHDTFISEEQLQAKNARKDVDPDKHVEELDLEDPHHGGIFAGSKGFSRTQVHTCDLCSFQAFNPALFAVLDPNGLPPTANQPGTEEYTVNQLTNKFGFLRKLSKEDLATLKKEVKTIVDGGTLEHLSEVTQRVKQALNEFRERANSTDNDREYAEACEVMKVCAGCGGLIHGKQYWTEVEYTDLNKETYKAYTVTSEWRNQFQMSQVYLNTAGSNRQLKRGLRQINKWIDSKICWAAVNMANLTTKQRMLIQRGADWMTPLGGPNSKVNVIYICRKCNPHPQGSVHSGGWYLTTSAIVLDPATNKLTKIVNAQWKCPFCGAKYKLCSGARALCIDDREI